MKHAFMQTGIFLKKQITILNYLKEKNLIIHWECLIVQRVQNLL